MTEVLCSSETSVLTRTHGITSQKMAFITVYTVHKSVSVREAIVELTLIMGLKFCTTFISCETVQIDAFVNARRELCSGKQRTVLD
jgi:hypothetical protein